MALAIDDLDSHEYWQILSELQHRGDRATLDQMLRLSRGDLPARRLALNVLGRFAEPEWPFRAEIVARLLEMWQGNAGDEMSDLVAALSHHCEFAPVREILLSLVHHPDFLVRWYLTFAFGDDENYESTAALIQLSCDCDEAIRDWATFALGNSEHLYSPAVRAALIARLDDTDATTRLEAINGLAERGDLIVLDAILKAFEPDENGETTFEKTEQTPLDRILPALQEMSENATFSSADAENLRAAIEACNRYLA